MMIIRSAMAVLLLGFAAVTNGYMEKILWIVFTLFIAKEMKGKTPRKIQYQKRIGGAIAGYCALLLILYFLQYNIEPMKAGVNYVDTKQKAVILVLQEEDQVYQLPLALKKTIQSNSLLGNIKLPFQLFSYKMAYAKSPTGKNYHINKQIGYRIQEILSDEYTVYVARTHSKPFLEEALQSAIQNRNEHLIIAPIMITENRDVQQLHYEMSRLNLSQYRVKTKTTTPLWDSDVVAQSFIHQMEKEMVMPRNKQGVGIVLVGEERKPGDEDQLYIKQDILFREKMKDLLVLQGYNSNKIRLTPLDNKAIHRDIETLMEYGVGKIVVVVVSSTAQEINQMKKIRGVMKKIDSPNAVEIQLMNPWNHEEIFIEEIIRRIQLTNLQKWN